MDERARAWSFERELQDRCARTRREFEYGTALYNEELPRVYDANFVRFDRGLDELTADAVQEAADELQASMAHRKVMIAEEETGARVAEDLRGRGWRMFTLVTMAYRGPRERDPAAAERAREVSPEELHEARVRSLDDGLRDPGAARQIVAFTERLAGSVPTRLVAASARPDEEIGGFCSLFHLGGIGQIDEVVTIERHRRQGLGRAVVEYALQSSLRAGDDLTFLVADESDWPREWYARLGFEPIARRYELLRT